MSNLAVERSEPGKAPIAVYRERIPGVRRQTLHLFADRLVVAGHTFWTSWDATFRLREMDPQYAVLRARNQYVVVRNIGFLVLVLLFSPWVFAALDAGGYSLILLAGYALLLVACAMNVCVSLRRRTFVTFLTNAALDRLHIGKVGPDKDHFDGFVDALVRQIHVAQGKQPGSD